MQPSPRRLVTGSVALLAVVLEGTVVAVHPGLARAVRRHGGTDELGGLGSRDDHDRSGPQGRPVGVEPWATCLLNCLPVLALWMIVRIGRAMCLVAQRIPPAVRLVRVIRSSGVRRQRQVERRAV